MENPLDSPQNSPTLRNPTLSSPELSSPNDRYLRQMRFAPIGMAGQERISEAQVLVCGCGALGSVIVERLARAGVGRIRIVDRDWVELSNLQRQTLFAEEHAAHSTPKAVAAASELARINHQVHVEPVVDDLTCDNILEIAADCDLILDGTDNFETRFLINDYSVRYGVPWIHAGCLGASGQLMSIIPGTTACFRCLVPELPSPGLIQSCDTAGVLGPSVALIACWQATEALKFLSGNFQAVCTQLIVLDSWETDCRKVNLRRTEGCPCCGLREFPFLDGKIRTESIVLCGKNAVQIVRPVADGASNDLPTIFERLRDTGEVQLTAFFVRLRIAHYQITFFRGGRTVIEGTTSEAEAKTLIARTLGS